MNIEIVQPDGWKKPKGYANGVVLSGAAKLVFVAGQIAWDAEQKIVGRGDFGAQFEQALRNVLAVVTEAGGRADDVVRMLVFVVDKARPCGDRLGHLRFDPPNLARDHQIQHAVCRLRKSQHVVR